MHDQNPNSGNDHDILNNLILTYWNYYQPTMLAQFRRENRLEEELKATKERFSDLVYRLVAEQKMSYPAAWEIAIHDLLEAEEESSSTNLNRSQSPRAISA